MSNHPGEKKLYIIIYNLYNHIGLYDVLYDVHYIYIYIYRGITRYLGEGFENPLTLRRFPKPANSVFGAKTR